MPVYSSSDGIVNGGVINFQPGGGSIKTIFSAQSDFVYSTVEEFGVLIGGLGLLLLYLILFFRC